MTEIHLGPGACGHCLAAPGEKCAIKRKHRKGWRAPCVIEREDREEAELLAIWEEVMASRARVVEAARLEARRRQRKTDIKIELGIWAAIMVALCAYIWLAPNL